MFLIILQFHIKLYHSDISYIHHSDVRIFIPKCYLARRKGIFKFSLTF